MSVESIRNWVVEKILDRLYSGFAAITVSVSTTRLIQSQTRLQSEMEDQARQLEAEGKHKLAAQLRAKSESLSPEQSAEWATGFLNHLAETESQLRLNFQDDGPENDRATKPPSPAPRRRSQQSGK